MVRIPTGDINLPKHLRDFLQSFGESGSSSRFLEELGSDIGQATF
jgi:hypothetical protein